MTMWRFVRQSLFASLVAWHAAVMLCGPCLHELAGSTHGDGAVSSKGQRPVSPAQPSREATDGCLICHFVAQGQLPVEFSRESLPQPIAELVISASPISHAVSGPLPSSPRAPPLVFPGLS